MAQRETLERKNDAIERRDEGGSSRMNMLGIVGGITLVALAALVVVTLPDIRRYIKISTM